MNIESGRMQCTSIYAQPGSNNHVYVIIEQTDREKSSLRLSKSPYYASMLRSGKSCSVVLYLFSYKSRNMNASINKYIQKHI